MSFPTLCQSSAMPDRTRTPLANQPLGEFTWFRVGGPAQVFFMPEDENDLAYLLRNLSTEIPVTVIGAGSNLIVRDGGVPEWSFGLVFNEWIEEHRVAGTAMLDVMVARAAQAAGVAGLFLSGIPGTIGGALRMNGGAYGGETKDVLLETRGDRHNLRTFSNGEMGFSYRHCSAPDDVIFTAAVLQGRAGEAEQIAGEMATIKKSARQPSRATAPAALLQEPSRPQRMEACRRGPGAGSTIGGAQVSELHSNFLINLGSASAADIETLGETVREKVKENSGIDLEWEIKRVGVTLRQ